MLTEDERGKFGWVEVRRVGRGESAVLGERLTATGDQSSGAKLGAVAGGRAIGERHKVGLGGAQKLKGRRCGPQLIFCGSWAAGGLGECLLSYQLQA